MIHQRNVKEMVEMTSPEPSSRATEMPASVAGRLVSEEHCVPEPSSPLPGNRPPEVVADHASSQSLAPKGVDMS